MDHRRAAAVGGRGGGDQRSAAEPGRGETEEPQKHGHLRHLP